MWKGLANLFGGQDEKDHTLNDSKKAVFLGAFKELSEEEKKQVLKEGAERFTRDFKETIVTLANE